LVGLAAVLFAAAAGAEEGRFAPRVSLGGGIEGAGPNFEVTATPWQAFLAPHFSVGWSNPGNATYAYGEIATYFVLTLGVGGGEYAAGGQSAFRGHLFVGLPIPLVALTEAGDVTFAPYAFAERVVPPFFIYLEPYWRELIERGPFDWNAELGLSLKLSFGRAKHL
jgi:hypothetical protein